MTNPQHGTQLSCEVATAPNARSTFIVTKTAKRHATIVVTVLAICIRTIHNTVKPGLC